MFAPVLIRVLILTSALAIILANTLVTGLALIHVVRLAVGQAFILTLIRGLGERLRGTSG